MFRKHFVKLVSLVVYDKGTTSVLCLNYVLGAWPNKTKK